MDRHVAAPRSPGEQAHAAAPLPAPAGLLALGAGEVLLTLFIQALIRLRPSTYIAHREVLLTLATMPILALVIQLSESLARKPHASGKPSRSTSAASP